jgi:NAD-dependent SIR2 family protein deacetylase
VRVGGPGRTVGRVEAAVAPVVTGSSGALDVLRDLVGAGGVVVLSGAGISTESGIPDYRGPTGAARRVTPMTYQLFTQDPVARRRYWARSHLGWRLVDRARPNEGHRAVAEMEARGLLRGIVTQNVDGLHQAAGARSVIDLHGRLDRVVCLDCRALSRRDELAERLHEANPEWDAAATAINPDGDVELPDERLDGFRTVDCTRCAGTLKPDVVFFGENVPAGRVAECYDLVDRSRALLVLGSSLTVFSGHRFVLRAAKRGIPVGIVNQGATRGDPLAAVTVDAPLGTTLSGLTASLPA